MNDNVFLPSLKPIIRSTPSQRKSLFLSKEYSIYNSIDPYYQAGGGTGPNQPFIYTKLTAPNSEKTRTKYDTQALPVGSTVRDTVRLTKFLGTGTGILYTGKQILLQAEAAFDETRTYNFGSIIAGANVSLGGNRPLRHIESSGGFSDFIVGGILGAIGINSSRASAGTIKGTATAPLPRYVQTLGNGRYGLMRGETAITARKNFDRVWLGAGRQQGNSSFLQSVIRGISSTTGIFNGRNTANWDYRAEYVRPTEQSKYDNVYNYMLADPTGLLAYTGLKPLYVRRGISTGRFYNDSLYPLGTTEIAGLRIQRQKDIANAVQLAGEAEELGDPMPTIENENEDLDTIVRARDIMRNFPNDQDGTQYKYAGTKEMKARIDNDTEYDSGTIAIYNKMLNLLENNVGNDKQTHPMYKKSAERYANDEKLKITEKNNYKTATDPNKKYSLKKIKDSDFNIESVKESSRAFAKGRSKLNPLGMVDEYNRILPFTSDETGIPSQLKTPSGQSRDLIFFYIKDLVNNKYIPFRAVLSNIYDNNSAEVEDFSYMGRADKLFIYRGFKRDLTFSLKVYANSIKELIPMWKRINYLVGLTRPSKYTQNTMEANDTSSTIYSTISNSVSNGAVQMTPLVVGENKILDFQGKQFIYPPYVKFRLGDLFDDQPAIINNISVTVPEDATWETYRSDDNYMYEYGDTKFEVSSNISSLRLQRDNARQEIENAFDLGDAEQLAAEERLSTIENTPEESIVSKQLPNIVDISISMNLLEKTIPQTDGLHYGNW